MLGFKEFNFKRWIEDKKNIKWCLVGGFLIVIFVCIAHHYRYAPFFYIQKFYDYRIENSINAGNYAKAEKLLKNKLLFCKSAFDKENTINYLIRFYTNQRMYDEAEKLYLQKLNENMLSPVWECGNGNEKLDKGDLYNSLALICLNAKKYEKSSEYAQRALQIFNAQKGKSDVTEKFIRSYEILGALYLSLNNNEKAKEYCEKIKKYAQKGKSEDMFFGYYGIKMQYYKNIKDYKNAEIYAKKMYAAIPSTVLPFPFHSQMEIINNYVPFINNHLGEIYYLQGKYIDAKRMHEIAYKIDTESKGKYSTNVACDSYYLSIFYKNVGNSELHIKYFNQAKEIAKKFKKLQENTGTFESNMNNFCNNIHR